MEERIWSNYYATEEMSIQTLGERRTKRRSYSRILISIGLVFYIPAESNQPYGIHESD